MAQFFPEIGDAQFLAGAPEEDFKTQVPHMRFSRNELEGRLAIQPGLAEFEDELALSGAGFTSDQTEKFTL